MLQWADGWASDEPQVPVHQNSYRGQAAPLLTMTCILCMGSFSFYPLAYSPQGGKTKHYRSSGEGRLIYWRERAVSTIDFIAEQQMKRVPLCSRWRGGGSSMVFGTVCESVWICLCQQDTGNLTAGSWADCGGESPASRLHINLSSNNSSCLLCVCLCVIRISRVPSIFPASHLACVLFGAIWTLVAVAAGNH